jgi:hypothetical protein
VLIDNLKKRGNVGNGTERCEVSGSGLSLALHMNNPAVEYLEQSLAISPTLSPKEKSCKDDTDCFISVCAEGTDVACIDMERRIIMKKCFPRLHFG